MSTKHLLLKPQGPKLPRSWWYYEEPDGLHILADPGPPAQIQSFVISWARIRAALKRRDRRP